MEVWRDRTYGDDSNVCIREMGSFLKQREQVIRKSEMSDMTTISSAHNQQIHHYTYLIAKVISNPSTLVSNPFAAIPALLTILISPHSYKPLSHTPIISSLSVFEISSLALWIDPAILARSHGNQMIESSESTDGYLVRRILIASIALFSDLDAMKTFAPWMASCSTVGRPIPALCIDCEIEIRRGRLSERTCRRLRLLPCLSGLEC